MNRLEHFAHNLRLRTAENHPELMPVLDSKITNVAFAIGSKAVNWRYEQFGPSGQIEWSHISEVVEEAMRRGAMRKESEEIERLEHIYALQPKSMIEVGIRRGAGLFGSMHVISPEAQVFAVGQSPNGGEYSTRLRKRIESYCGENQTLELITADAASPTTGRMAMDFFKNKPVDFVMLDAERLPEEPHLYWDLYSSLVRSGGMITIHGIAGTKLDKNNPWPSFWQEIKKLNYEYHEIIENPHLPGSSQWGGVGIVIIP